MEGESLAERYFADFVAAFVRGRLGSPGLPTDELIARGPERGLRLHRFKRKELPRVRRVIGILKGLAPCDLLDVGSGRGTFLWPLLDALPDLPVTAVDVSLGRVATWRRCEREVSAGCGRRA